MAFLTQGTAYQPGQSIEDFAKVADLDWTVSKQHVYHGDNINCNGWRALVRSDSQDTLGMATERYQLVQPLDVLNGFTDYIKVDPRFALDRASCVNRGALIWATASFNGEMTIAGDAHKAFLLMTTSFDGTLATIHQASMTRLICTNQLHAHRKTAIRTRHNTKLDKARILRELAVVISGFESYKAMGDAMARAQLTKEQISQFFKSVLDIPFDAKREDISTRKSNQFAELNDAYRQTATETDQGTAWCALNAVTRYVDHDRATRTTGDRGEARFVSAQFGSGAALKEKAVMVLDEMCDGDLLRAVASKTAEVSDVSDLLRQPFRASIGN